jgi:hypothetical protein
MSTAPTPAHRGRAPGRLKLTLAALAVVLLAAIFGMLVVDRIFFKSAVTGINSRNLTVALLGSGNIDATGTATKLKVTLGGEGNTLLRELIARDVHAALTGEGSIMLTATHSLTARISGDGTVLYSGNPPHVTQGVTGSGTISPQ